MYGKILKLPTRLWGEKAMCYNDCLCPDRRPFTIVHIKHSGSPGCEICIIFASKGSVQNRLACCSLCPTFAAIGAFINNARWDGVPFLLKAGKALHSKRAEIRVQFRHVPGNLYKDKLGMDPESTTNELVRLPCALYIHCSWNSSTWSSSNITAYARMHTGLAVLESLIAVFPILGIWSLSTVDPTNCSV